MKTILIMIVLAIICAFVPSHSASGHESGPQAADAVLATKHESPFACDRLALTPEIRKRHFDVVGPKLRTLRTGVRELPDGYEFAFPSDQATFDLLAEWVSQERLCCPFFDIGIRLESEGGPLWLRLTGRPGTKDFIKVDGAKWIK
jgi:hypothetical protein